MSIMKERETGLPPEQTNALEKAGYCLLGIDSEVPIIGGAEHVIYGRPQLVFKGERLHVEYAIARFFWVTAVGVGRCVTGVASVDPIPADVFSLRIEESGLILPGQRIEFKMARPNEDVWVRVVNRDAKSHRFVGAIIGREVEPTTRLEAIQPVKPK